MIDLADDTIKEEVRIKRILFNKDNFYIFVSEPILTKNGDTENYKEHTFKGECPSISMTATYKILAKRIEDKKYGTQYQIQQMYIPFEFKDNDIEGKRMFLSHLFTELQVQNMYDALPDPFDTLQKEDYVALCTVKGIAMKTAVGMVTNFKSNLGNAKIYTELADYELTDNMIEKLISIYNGNIDLLIEKVKHNPYSLIKDVPGIGFAKADSIAQKGGMAFDSPERIAAYVQVYLYNKGLEGYSWITVDHLWGAIIEALGEEVSDEKIQEGIKTIQDILWTNEDRTHVGLMKFYTIEQKIANELIRIRDAKSDIVADDWEDAIKRLERLNGWSFTEEQKIAIETGNNNNVFVLTGGSGCVDCDTEYFNGEKWVKISDYNGQDLVLQYNEDNTAELVKPIRYIKQPKDYLWHFNTKYGLDQCLSDNHECYYITSKGNLYHKPFFEVMKDQNNKGFRGKFITSFNYSGKGIDLTDDEIRLKVAIFADGSFYYNNFETIPDTSSSLTCRFHLKKERKKKRLEWLLDRLQHNYVKKESSCKGYHDFYVQTDSRDKHFPKEWYQCSKHQMEVIKDEILHWDGCLMHNKFTTTNKDDADFIQFVYSSLGYRSSIRINNRVGKTHCVSGKIYVRKSIEYTVSFTKRSLCGLNIPNDYNIERTEIEKYKTKDGYEYCFTVPSHMLVLRRNNKIFITGNCGKTSTVQAILKANKDFPSTLCALSGRAASRMFEVTGKEGQTIHRLLGYPMGPSKYGGFEFNQDNQLEVGIYVLDEASMVGSELFNSLIRAIPNGSKLIILGDQGQLESIGSGNILHDIIHSNEIATINLTKIHRQAAKSAIITESLKVRKGIQIIPKDWAGQKTLGELQDLHINCYSDASNTVYETIKAFTKEIAVPDFNIMDLQVIAPVKTRGDACVRKLNEIMQEMYNPLTEEDKKKPGIHEIKVFQKKYVTFLRVGDKVINKKNNYKIKDINGDTTQIFNGSQGVVTEIRSYDSIVVDFAYIGKVVITKDALSGIELGYCISCHASQGSEYKTVIFALDNASYTLLTRELVYTAITRAKEKCYLIAQTGALRTAIAREGVSVKQTHLEKLLYEIAHPKLIF